MISVVEERKRKNIKSREKKPGVKRRKKDEFSRTKRRVLTRRGVVWLGQTCNLRCHFCYFLDRVSIKEHPEHPFMSLEKAKKMCFTLVDFYKNNAIDIQGGEPTIYPHIYELVRYCSEIGLLPTLITNALVLSRRKSCERLKESGIRDLLISIHGLKDTYDQTVGVPGAHAKQMRALEHLQELAIPFRFNCVLTKMTLPQLNQIADLARQTKCRVVNFIAFNPFEDQQKQGKRSRDNVPRYSQVKPFLTEALDLLAEAGIESNVRYFPLCMVEDRHRKVVYNFQQLPYDIHEWDYASWSWTGMVSQRTKEGDTSSVISLEEATYQPLSYPGPLKHAASAAKRLVLRFPRLREPAEALHRKLSRAVHQNRFSADKGEYLHQLYRANGIMRATRHCNYLYSSQCKRCAVRQICDGFHGDYAAIFGTDEATPISSEIEVSDPLYYISEQEKVVEVEDYEWAL